MTMQSTQPIPSITVITVVKNSEKTLERAIKSLIDQQYPDLEYIVLDGGSTDGTVGIIKQYESYISYWHSKPDAGPNAAYDIGIQLATKNFVAFLNADDWFEPGTLTAVVNGIINNPSARIITCGARVVQSKRLNSNDHDFTTGNYIELRRYTSPKELALTFENMLFGAPLVNARFFDRTIFSELGGFHRVTSNKGFVISEDRAFLLDAALHHIKNIVIPHLGYTYYSHTNSITFSHTHAVCKKTLHEHLVLVDKLLQSPLIGAKETKQLYNWHRDQSVRLFLRELLSRNIIKAYDVAKEGFKKSSFYWFITLIGLPISVIFSRLQLAILK